MLDRTWRHAVGNGTPLFPWKHSSDHRPTSYTQEAHRAAKRGRSGALLSAYESSDSENNLKTRHKVGSKPRRHIAAWYPIARIRAAGTKVRPALTGREHAPGEPLTQYVGNAVPGRAAGRASARGPRRAATVPLLVEPPHPRSDDREEHGKGVVSKPLSWHLSNGLASNTTD
jgi:hypothetical protein